MQRVLSAVSAGLLGLAIMLTSVVGTFAAPVSPQPVQVTSNVEQIKHRRWHHRNGWDNRRYGWRGDRRGWRGDRYEWRRDRYQRRYWNDRRDRRWYGHRRYYQPYMGGSGRSHQ